MNQTKESRYYVDVCGWRRERLVEVRGNTVAMEIARIACSHCAVCSGRMETVINNVKKAGLNVNWERREGGQMIVLPLPENTDPVEYLRNVLSLSINRC
jgi:hypothetical protein